MGQVTTVRPARKVRHRTNSTGGCLDGVARLFAQSLVSICYASASSRRDLLKVSRCSWYAEDCERLAMLQQLRLLNLLVVGSVGSHFFVVR